MHYFSSLMLLLLFFSPKNFIDFQFILFFKLWEPIYIALRSYWLIPYNMFYISLYSLYFCLLIRFFFRWIYFDFTQTYFCNDIIVLCNFGWARVWECEYIGSFSEWPSFPEFFVEFEFWTMTLNDETCKYVYILAKWFCFKK